MGDISLSAINALEKAIDAKIANAAKGRTRIGATVSRIDVDGTPYVVVDGSDVETPAAYTAASVRPGDRVTATVQGGRLTVDGNYSDPAASSATVVNVERKADTAMVEAERAHSAADAAEFDAARAASAADNAEQSAEAAATAAQNAWDHADEAATAASVADGKAVEAATAAQNAWDYADSANTAAGNAWDHADSAATAAGNAWDRAGDALTAARSAQASANAANTYSNAALDQLAVVQDVAGILTWASEHGSFELTQDQSIVDGKVYFTYDSTTHDYTPVVDPQASALSTYYELTVDEAMNDFIMAHLAVTTRGLWVLPAGLPSTDQTVDNTVDKASSSDTSAQKQANANARKASDYKVLLSNDGLYVYDGDGVLVSTFGESITFSSLRQQYIGNEDAYILFTPASGSTAGSITIGGANVTLGSSKKLSELLEEVDAKAARGTGILHVTTAPSSYTTTQGGFTPSYRMSLSTAKSQAGVAEVIVGDIVEHDSWHYPVGYVSSSYVYMGERVSIKGAQGETGGTGSQGAAGLNQATVYLYKRADSASKPSSGSWTYTFATGQLSSVPSGWSQTFPAETQGSTTPVWMMCAVASANTATDDISYSEWTTPIKMVSSGTNGYNTATVYLYQRKSSQPSKPSNTLTYTFSSHSITSGTINNGWSTSIPSTGDDPLWVTAATATGTGTTDTIASSDWATPVQLAANGTNGTNGTNGLDGLNTASIYLYQRAASSPSLPSSAVTYTFATGALSSVPTGWSRSVPTVDGNPCWVTSAVAISSDATDSIAASEWVTPAKMAEDGEDGYNHAVVTLYQRAASTPSKPSGTVTYTFSTGALSSVPSGWSTGVPSGSNPCYVTQAACVSQSDTYSISSSAWSSPVKLVEDGAKGDTGPEAVVDVTFDSVDWAAGSATLRASLLVNGSAPSGTVTYQWRKNGSNVSGATSQTVSIGSGTGDMTAVWSCAVTWDGYTQAGSIDLAPLAEAAAVAGNYIVETATNDVWIHSEGHGPDTDPNSQTYGEATQDTYGWRIGSVFELIRAGASYLKMWVDSNLVARMRVGLESAGHSIFSPDGMEVFAGTNGADSVAKFGSNGAQIGKTDSGNYMMIDSDGMDVIHATTSGDTTTTTEVAHFGYGQCSYGNVTYTAPYFSFGNRASGSNVGGWSFAEGRNTAAIGHSSHSEGDGTWSGNNASHSEGVVTSARGYGSHSEGVSNHSTISSGIKICGIDASGDGSHAEGYASNSSSISITASGTGSHAEGYVDNSSGDTIAAGNGSHAQNYGTRALSNYQTALGKCNVADSNNTYAVIVGNGTADNARSNALTIDWNGNVECGNVECGNVNGTATQSTGTLASSDNQTALGKYNVSDANNTYAVIVGNGTADNARSNAFAVTWDGTIVLENESTLWDNSNGNTHLLTPESGKTAQAEYSFEASGLYIRKRTRTSTTAAWSSWSSWTLIS